MELLFAKKAEKICTSMKEAKKILPLKIAVGLFANLETLRQACTIEDIRRNPVFHFHSLQGKLEGYFAIDIKGRKSGWRMILEVLDEEGHSFNPCRIDKIAPFVKIIRIEEVSNHYE